MSAELEHRPFLLEGEQSRLAYGAVLTAGYQIKKSPDFTHPWIDEDGEHIYPYKYRTGPDPEGKMRALAAFHDLQSGRINRILVAGGSRVEDYSGDKSVYVPLARIYARYLKRLAKAHNLNPRLIQ